MSVLEVSERLVGSPAFKAGGTGDPRPAGSIPVHLRQPNPPPAQRRGGSGNGFSGPPMGDLRRG